MRSDQDCLSDIAEAIQRIGKYARMGRAHFDSDELVRTFIIHQLLLIGEAARGISESLRVRTPDIEWAVIIGMRNRLIHGYFQVDAAEVWKTVERDVPKLQEQAERLIEP